ncbi:MurR/RpiR family transcriptional regulator [Mesorhizobium sp. YC-39]|uniref:MurR/RpiR family transcriptional regulator n=1 Tax=unclassified Mesorhizobium TaxID=325217 RepID=UPI0021E85FB0|nr:MULTISPECIES: MurR/RpiR family transcriptional regulator [unclassified Mesorhizobium]MCV3211638.1 MurR/RpiR family transcriptional regulator [Mesorhizobium sp. YC-2]MCV3233313.1 MurR/RpiR family transcriptional regulator [Mesorhizobium sp. YC-39]
MEKGPLAGVLVDRFERMPRQLQLAARFVLDHPQDVALMSMREQAHLAGVSHTTMMRLARWVGLDGYEDMRSLYAKAIRTSAEPALPGRREEGDGGCSTVGEVAATLTAQIARLGEGGNAMQLMAAASVLAASRNLFSLGLRAEHPVALHFAYTLSQLGRQAVVLDAAGGLGIDALRGAGKGDAVLAVGIEPYCRATIETVRHAARQGIAVVAITDSRVSPLASTAKESVIVTSSSQSFFKSIAPAVAASEILAALIAVKSGMNVDEVVKDTERQLAELDVFWKPTRQRAGAGESPAKRLESG